MKIAILGGGHGCYAAAADLSEAGHEVRLWRREAAALQPVQDAGSITLKDSDGARDVPIARATADIGEALAGEHVDAIDRKDGEHAVAPIAFEFDKVGIARGAGDIEFAVVTIRRKPLAGVAIDD